MGILTWIIVGALTGSVASRLAATTRQYGWLENIIVGIIGAFLGGFLLSPLTGRQMTIDWNVGSFLAAIIGALVPLIILQLVWRAET